MADELVGTEEEYRNVAKAMLGRIVVVDNVDNAVKIARNSITASAWSPWKANS